MKTLYESILSSTGAGKDMFEPKYDHEFMGNSFYNVKNCSMKDWFKNPNENIFQEIIGIPIKQVRKEWSPVYTVIKFACISFKDGDFVIHFINSNKEIQFRFYFANKIVQNHAGERTCLGKQYRAINGESDKNTYKYWQFEKGLSIKKCAAQLLEFIKNNLDKIIKQ